jgi:hypothetical protein
MPSLNDRRRSRRLSLKDKLKLLGLGSNDCEKRKNTLATNLIRSKRHEKLHVLTKVINQL